MCVSVWIREGDVDVTRKERKDREKNNGRTYMYVLWDHDNQERKAMQMRM